MRRIVISLIVISLIVLSTHGRTVAQTPATGGTAKPAVEEVLKAVRADLQSSRADIMAKNITLTAEQAARFWPMFNKYQQEQNVIMDAQLKAVQQFVDTAATLDDAGALALIKGHLERDAKMNALRQSFLAEFQTILPTKTAARVIQIDRRLSIMTQLEIISRIPLIH